MAENLPAKVVLFQGGADKQRDHLNKLVELANDSKDAIEELQNKAANPTIIALVDAGTLADFEIDAVRVTV
jgi:hypothetical protein